MVLSKRQYTLAATSLGSSLAFIDASAVIIALPTMQKALHLGLNGEQWVFLSYSLALASLYLIGGALGDRFGHRRVFTSGTIGFAIASAIAGITPNGALLISARVLQGISGAFVTTNSLAWLRSVYGEQAGKAVGLWTSLTGISTIAAPPIGGALTQWLSWRYIFYINLPLAALVLYWAARAVPDKVHQESKKPLDYFGSALIALALGFMTFYLVQGAKSGFKQLWWSLVIGLACLSAFVFAEKKQKSPLLPFELFRVRNFTFANLETLLIYGALGGILVYFTLYLQFLGLSPLASSLFLIPTSIIMIILAPYFGARSDNIGARSLLTAGPALIGLGVIIFSIIHNKSEIWLRGSLGVLLFSLGLAMMVAPITATALKSAPAKFAGLASGINNTVSRTGNLIAVAVVGMAISVIFYGTINDKSAVPLALHQSSPALRAASHHGYQIGMWIVAGLSFSAAVVGWSGIVNKPQTETEKEVK